MKQNDDFFIEQIMTDDSYIYGRVVVDYGTGCKIETEEGLVEGTVSGRYRNSEGMMPVIGDVVGMTLYNDGNEGLIHRVLERKSAFKRKVAGNRNDMQVQGANFDTVFIVMALNNDFNVRKLERFTLAAWDTGAMPVIIMTKTDLCDDVSDKLQTVYEVTPGIEVHAISAVNNEGLEPVLEYMEPGKIIALFGASGVGKSTLINCIAGKEVMKVNDVRHGDDRGKHTTTHREIIWLDNGVGLMDTPGMREVGIWDDGEGVDRTFSDIAQLTELCRFKDCSHNNEPGCAVREALASGELDESRYDSYLKLKKEAAFIERKYNQKLRMEEQRKWKSISKGFRQRNKVKY